MRASAFGLAGRNAIMLLLVLLVALFVGGMWLLSGLNLRMAESSLAQLREQQIHQAVHASLERIDARHRRMRQHTQELVQIARLLVGLGGGPEAAEEALRQALVDFPDAMGVVLWLADAVPPQGVYAWRDGETLRVEPLEAGRSEDAWLGRRLAAWRDGTRPMHWTASFLEEPEDAVLISVSAPVRSIDGQLLGVVASDWTATDIIELIDSAAVAPNAFAFLVDRQGHYLSSTERLAGEEQARALGTAIDELSWQRAEGNAPRRHALSLGGETWTLFYASTRADMLFGIAVPQAEIDAVLVPMRHTNLQIMGAVGAGMLLLALVILLQVARMLRQLHTLYTDPLTGRPNRARLLADLEGHRPGALVLVNVDGFKQYNGVFGQECGDQVIRHLTMRLAEVLKGAEWRGGRLYRMPGDEQAIWLPGWLPTALLERRLHRLQEAVGTTRMAWQDEELTLRVTLGLAATWQLEEEGREALIAAAGMALREARKRQLGWRIHDAAKSVREGYGRNLDRVGRLTAALDEGRIAAYFQPIMALASGRVTKYECLMRLIDEQGEPVNPVPFLKVAGRSRLRRSLTLTMVERCLEAMGGNDHDFSFNLSAEDLVDPEVSEPLLKRVAESGLGQRLILEILESQSIGSYAAVSRVIARARALGVRIAIDDFGTGYANFEHLLRLDVDLLKIDGSLIRHLDSDPQALTLTRGIVRFARELGLETVAEFVHGPEVLERVRELGIDYAQGAYIGMPASQPLAATLPGAGR